MKKPTKKPLKRTKKKMPLHRDIFWVGKQWSVTGDGMQAIDQKLKGKFDIEISRLWDDDLAETMQDKKWFNIEDFTKGLAVARKHYPQPARKAGPAKAGSAKAESSKAESSKTESAKAESAKTESSKAMPAGGAPVLAAPAASGDSVAVKDQPTAGPAPVNFSVRMEGVRAKFLPAWRIRARAPH